MNLSNNQARKKVIPRGQRWEVPLLDSHPQDSRKEQGEDWLEIGKSHIICTDYIEHINKVKLTLQNM